MFTCEITLIFLNIVMILLWYGSLHKIDNPHTHAHAYSHIHTHIYINKRPETAHQCVLTSGVQLINLRYNRELIYFIYMVL